MKRHGTATSGETAISGGGLERNTRRQSKTVNPLAHNRFNAKTKGTGTTMQDWLSVGDRIKELLNRLQLNGEKRREKKKGEWEPPRNSSRQRGLTEKNPQRKEDAAGPPIVAIERANSRHIRGSSTPYIHLYGRTRKGTTGGVEEWKGETIKPGSPDDRSQKAG